MSPAAPEILGQALRLSESERDWLIGELNASLDLPPTPERDAALLELLEHRRAEYLAGRVGTVSMEEVMAQVWAKLAAKKDDAPLTPAP